MLVGPTGIGKSLLVSAVISHISKQHGRDPPPANTISLFHTTIGTFASCWEGYSVMVLDGIFEAAIQHAPSVITFDFLSYWGLRAPDNDRDAQWTAAFIDHTAAASKKGVLVIGTFCTSSNTRESVDMSLVNKLDIACT